MTCRKPLDDVFRHMNMEFHPGECARIIIQRGWHFIDKEHKDNDTTRVTTERYEQAR